MPNWQGTVDPQFSGPQLSSTSIIQHLDYPAWEFFGCALIRKHVEFASSAIENVLISVSRTFHLIRIAKKDGVDTGVRITEGPQSHPGMGEGNLYGM